MVIVMVDGEGYHTMIVVHDEITTVRRWLIVKMLWCSGG